MATTRAPWRSLLFVPAQIERFVARAHERGADAVVLDLEDAVPAGLKAEARAGLAAAAARIGAASSGSTDVLVRINAEDDRAGDDVQAAVAAGAVALVVPKAAEADAVRALASAVDRAEAAAGRTAGSVGLLLQIEDVRALPHLDALATASPRVLGLSLGSEDFSLSAGLQPTPRTLLLPNQLLQFACARAGIHAYGFPASIADYADLDAFEQHVRFASELGFVGALCVHPSQVAVLNRCYTPDDAAVADARAVIAAFDEALRAGRAAAEHAGRMVDPPVVARAQALLRRVRPPTPRSNCEEPS